MLIFCVPYYCSVDVLFVCSVMCCLFARVVVPVLFLFCPSIVLRVLFPCLISSFSTVLVSFLKNQSQTPHKSRSQTSKKSNFLSNREPPTLVIICLSNSNRVPTSTGEPPTLVITCLPYCVLFLYCLFVCRRLRRCRAGVGRRSIVYCFASV